MIAFLFLGLFFGFVSGLALGLHMWTRSARQDLKTLGHIDAILRDRERGYEPPNLHEVRGNWR